MIRFAIGEGRQRLFPVFQDSGWSRMSSWRCDVPSSSKPNLAVYPSNLGNLLYDASALFTQGEEV